MGRTLSLEGPPEPSLGKGSPNFLFATMTPDGSLASSDYFAMAKERNTSVG